MTLDDQIEAIYRDLATFVESEQWLSAVQAHRTIKDLIKLKEFIGYESSTISDDVETPEPD